MKNTLILAFISVFILVSCNSHHDSVPDKLIPANFKSVSKNIIEERCLSCHNAQKKEGGVDLSSYEKITSPLVFPALVSPGNPLDSTLYTSVASGKMPKDSPPLTPSELNAIYLWIKNGAKKDETIPLPDKPTSSEPGTGEPGTGEPGLAKSGKLKPNEPNEPTEPRTNEPHDDNEPF